MLNFLRKKSRFFIAEKNWFFFLVGLQVYLQLKSSDVFAYVRKLDLFASVKDYALQMMQVMMDLTTRQAELLTGFDVGNLDGFD